MSEDNHKVNVDVKVNGDGPFYVIVGLFVLSTMAAVSIILWKLALR